MRGRFHRGISPCTTIENLHKVAEMMIGKPVEMFGVVIGHIVSATVEGNYINWESKDVRCLHRKVRK